MDKLSNMMAANKYNNKLQQDLLSDDYKDYDKFPIPPQRDNYNEEKAKPTPTPTGPQKNETGKQFDKNGYEIIDFFTDYGNQRVTIDGDISSGRPIIVTYHDVGVNHNACFTSFFNMIREYDVKFRYFTIVHIDAPQHHYDDDNDRTNTSSTIYNDDESIDAFDLLELSRQIEEIRSKLQIEKFIGFGVGASCNLFTYYAMNYSHRLRGLILLNGIGGIATWREWVFDKLLTGIGPKSQFLTDSLHSSLLTRFFPRAVAKETYDYFLDQFDRIDTQSAIKFFRGFVRRQEFTEEQLSKIKTKTLIICGEWSRVKDETIQFQKKMPRQYTTFVLMSDTGFLLTESAPQKLCSSIDLFMQSLGLTKISLQSKFGEIEMEGQDGQTAEL